MKAIHLLHSFKQGGAENVALNYAIALNELNIPSLFIAKASNHDYERKLAQIGEISYHLKAELINEGDIIFVHCNQQLLQLIKLYNRIKRGHIRVVYVQHLLYSEKKFRLLSKLVNKLCTDFIVITPLIKSLVNKYIRLPQHNIINFYITKYPDEEWPAIRESIRKQYSIPTVKKVICFASVLKKGKGLQHFLQLTSRCTDKNDYHFLLVGDGPEAYMLKKYNYSNLTWVGMSNQVEKYLIASDYFYFPSDLPEMMPMSLIEAIDTDKIIIAKDTLVNNFLLNGITYADITSPDILTKHLPCGSELKHYDLSYGVSSLRKLCFDNR